MPNRLAQETSPYLQQHADNPVDWYPWCDQALALARATERPILLSVGYSACHWCHVMAHECFEDAETAALMNRHFVNIKVDREERPDIDQIYQAAHQLIARRPGGWPLTVFLTSDGKPFYGGTYFPKQRRYNLPGFDDLLRQVAQVWAEQRAAVMAQGDALVQHLATQLPALNAGAGDLDAALQVHATQPGAALRADMMQSFDATWGGFGAAPKFPQPPSLDALLRCAVIEHDDAARNAVLLTLQRMAEGGLYDHLGGGFFRYSTDAQWMIPHFEKMLYDNALLLRLYAQAWQLTNDALFRQVCEETAAWLMRDMQAREGGYFSSMDADSQGEEGRFYVWQRDEVAHHLDATEWAAFASHYGLDAAPNFERQAWHLTLARPLPEVAARLGCAQADCEASIANARKRLWAYRETRVRPGRDEKILTSWNALAIDAMLYAARVFGEPRWAASARLALDFVRAELWRGGSLLATYKDGRSHLNAYLDDYAFLLGAMLEFIQSGTLCAADLRFAVELAEVLLKQFEDPLGGGFFFTSHDHEALVLRPKSGFDGAMPSGNAVAAMHLQRLGHWVGEPRYLQAAQRALALFGGQARRAPQGSATWVSAMREAIWPPTLVMLTGPPAALAPWRAELARRYLPHVLLLQIPSNTSELPAVLAKPATEHAQAWVCRGPQCLAPVTNVNDLIACLSEPDFEV